MENMSYYPPNVAGDLQESNLEASRDAGLAHAALLMLMRRSGGGSDGTLP